MSWRSTKVQSSPLSSRTRGREMGILNFTWASTHLNFFLNFFNFIQLCSKSSFNLFFSVYLKREKILVEICSKVHEWIFFLCSHDFCLSNSPEWSNSSPMKKWIKTFVPWYSQENIFVKCGFKPQVVFRVFALQNGLWPAKDSKTFNCGLIPTTEGPDTRYSLPKSPTKRVPIT